MQVTSYYTKAFNSVDHNKLWKILQEWEYQVTLPASWEICMHSVHGIFQPRVLEWGAIAFSRL